MLSWVSVDLRTGRLLAELPDLSVDRVSAVLCSYTSTTATLPLPTAPENWERATMPEATALILLDDDRPVWGGRVTTQQLSMGDDIPMSLASFESYFDRRYVGDVTYEGVGQNEIVADLIDRFVNDGTINVRVEYTGAGQLRDRTYKDSSDKTVLSVLTELAGVEGGPEWTVGWEWQHDPERITPVLYVGDRIGTSPIAGLGPAATFEAPGPVVDAVLTRDFRTGKGATDVMAVSTATADVRPQSPRQIAANSERPTLEHRFTPSTSITEVSTLTSHAQRALSQMAGGAQALTLSAVVKDAPRLGLDWFIGDDIGYQIGSMIPDGRRGLTDIFVDEFVDTFGAFGLINPDGKPSIPAFGAGLSGSARCIGWELTLTEPQIIAPILADGDLNTEGI